MSEREKSESLSKDILSLSRSNATLEETNKINKTVTDIGTKLYEINYRQGAIKTFLGLVNEQYSDTTEIVKEMVEKIKISSNISQPQENNVIECIIRH